MPSILLQGRIVLQGTAGRGRLTPNILPGPSGVPTTIAENL